MELIKTDLKIDNQHAVQVAVSELEEMLYSKEKAIAAELSVASDDLEICGEAARAAMVAQTSDFFAAKSKAVLTSMKALFAKGEFSVDYRVESKLDVAATFTGVLVLTQVVDHRNVSFCERETLAVNKKVESALKKYGTTADIVEQLRRELREVRTAIASMGRIERRAMAKVAEVALADSKDGAKLLADIRASVFTSDIKKLLA